MTAGRTPAGDLSNRRLAQVAHATADDLSELCAAIDHGLLARIVDAQAGPPAGRFDRSSPRGGGAGSDPTGDAALRRVDATAVHRAELGRCLLRARAAIGRARQLADRYPEARAAGVGERAELARANGRYEPGCGSCARLHVAPGVARWEPRDSRYAGPTTVAGRLAEPMVLCVWCHDRTAQWGRLPTVDELEAHHEGRRVRWPTDVPRPKEARA